MRIAKEIMGAPTNFSQVLSGDIPFLWWRGLGVHLRLLGKIVIAECRFKRNRDVERERMFKL